MLLSAAGTCASAAACTASANSYGVVAARSAGVFGCVVKVSVKLRGGTFGGGAGGGGE